MISNKIKIMLFMPLLLSLGGCEPTIEDANKNGFHSLDEYLKVKEWGYSTKKQYMDALEFTPELFYKKCQLASDDDYEKNCQGRKVAWAGLVRHVSDDYVRISVLNIDGFPPSKKFNIDSKSMKKVIGKSDVGKIVELHGVIDKQNIVTPDIEKVYVSRFFSNEEVDAINNKQKELSLKMKQSLCKSNWKACKNRDDFLENSDRYTELRAYCFVEAENRAKYGDVKSSMLVYPFREYHNSDELEDGEFILIDRELQWPNEYGKYVKAMTICRVNIEKMEIVVFNTIPAYLIN